MTVRKHARAFRDFWKPTRQTRASQRTDAGSITASFFQKRLTDDAEDAQDVGCKNHQHVDDGEQDDGDGGVTQPAEGLGGEQHLLDGAAHLRAGQRRRR